MIYAHMRPTAGLLDDPDEDDPDDEEGSDEEADPNEGDSDAVENDEVESEVFTLREELHAVMSAVSLRLSDAQMRDAKTIATEFLISVHGAKDKVKRAYGEPQKIDCGILFEPLVTRLRKFPTSHFNAINRGSRKAHVDAFFEEVTHRPETPGRVRERFSDLSQKHRAGLFITLRTLQHIQEAVWPEPEKKL